VPSVVPPVASLELLPVVSLLAPFVVLSVASFAVPFGASLVVSLDVPTVVSFVVLAVVPPVVSLVAPLVVSATGALVVPSVVSFVMASVDPEAVVFSPLGEITAPVSEPDVLWVAVLTVSVDDEFPDSEQPDRINMLAVSAITNRTGGVVIKFIVNPALILA